RVHAGQVSGSRKARRLGRVADEVVAVAVDGAVHVGAGDGCARGVARAVGGGVTGDDSVLQSHRAGADADASACAFGREARRLVRSALVDAGVTRLRVVKTYRPVLDVDGGRVVVRDGAAVREAARAVIATVEAAV